MWRAAPSMKSMLNKTPAGSRFYSSLFSYVFSILFSGVGKNIPE
jgi:hypothetical protein